MKTFIIILIVAVCLTQGCTNCTPIGSKGYPQSLKDWISMPFPEYDPEEEEKSPEWYAANYSENEWEVFSDNGIVSAKPYNPEEEIRGQKPPFGIPDTRESYGFKYTFHVADGWLIGYNAGEWGGSLWWFSKDGKEKYKISDDQINGFLQTSYGIFGLQGLAHITMSKGSIVRIDKDKKTNKWRSELFVKLNESPDAATLDKDGSILVVTTYELARVSVLGRIEILVKDTFWGGLYPNSVAIDSNNIVYIGMRQGVAKISMANPSRIEWLVPSEKFLKDDFRKMEEFLRD